VTEPGIERHSPIWERAFLAALRRVGVVGAACEAADVARSTVYARRSSDPEFAHKWRDAQDDAADHAEAEALRRAIEGDRQPVLHNGKVVFIWTDARGNLVPEGTAGAAMGPLMKTSRSDLLLIFVLKALRPEKFRDNYDLRKAVVDESIDEEIRELAKQLRIRDPTREDVLTAAQGRQIADLIKDVLADPILDLPAEIREAGQNVAATKIRAVSSESPGSLPGGLVSD
jgi:hypothetical protein